MSTQQTKCMSYTMLCETLSIRPSLAVADLEASLGVGAKKITHNLVVAEKSTQNNTEKHRHFQHTDLNVEVPVNLTLITDLQNDITLKTLAKDLKQTHQRTTIETWMLVGTIHGECLSRASLHQVEVGNVALCLACPYAKMQTL